jgi:hypothetical protein
MTTQPVQRLTTTLAEYHSYLVRLWRPSPQADWRLMIELIPQGERQGFATLEALCHFLHDQMNPVTPPAHQEEESM